MIFIVQDNAIPIGAILVRIFNVVISIIPQIDIRFERNFHSFAFVLSSTFFVVPIMAQDWPILQSVIVAIAVNSVTVASKNITSTS